MTTAQRVWISETAHRRLREELDELRALNSRDAVTGEDSDQNLVVIEHARRNRIQQIHELLLSAVVGDDPPDDGVAEAGMVLTVRYEDTGDTETFLLGVRDTEHGGMEVYTAQSPLGSAILGARAGQRRSYCLPSGATMTVTLLRAVPYGLHRSR